jgi:hypothetical protein
LLALLIAGTADLLELNGSEQGDKTSYNHAAAPVGAKRS